MSESKNQTVLITGGAGYVGAVLTPLLLKNGYKVKIYDLYLFGNSMFDGVPNRENLEEIKGDIRDRELFRKSVQGCDTVIHLACISNDPSFELDPELGKSINFDCFPHLVQESKAAGVGRFIYASSSSVYGIKEEENVTEDLSLMPLTDYSKFKAMCEEILERERTDGFTTLTIRPATVCGYSPRLRLDLTVNILTSQALVNKRITVFGGDQKRPNIHVADMADLYLNALSWPAELIDGQVFNAGYDNMTVRNIAEKVNEVLGGGVEIVRTETNDNRSYHISSEKIKKVLNFVATRSVADAIGDIKNAFEGGKIQDPLNNPAYYNIKTMNNIHLT